LQGTPPCIWTFFPVQCVWARTRLIFNDSLNNLTGLATQYICIAYTIKLLHCIYEIVLTTLNVCD